MARLTAQRSREAMQAGVVRRHAEAQEIIGPVETSAPDMMLRQCGMQLRRLRMLHEPEQGRAAGNRKTCFHKDFVKRASLLLQRVARAVCPWLICQRGSADQQRRPGNRPWPQC